MHISNLNGNLREINTKSPLRRFYGELHFLNGKYWDENKNERMK